MFLSQSSPTVVLACLDWSVGPRPPLAPTDQPPGRPLALASSGTALPIGPGHGPEVRPVPPGSWPGQGDPVMDHRWMGAFGDSPRPRTPTDPSSPVRLRTREGRERTPLGRIACFPATRAWYPACFGRWKPPSQRQPGWLSAEGRATRLGARSGPTTPGAPLTRGRSTLRCRCCRGRRRPGRRPGPDCPSHSRDPAPVDSRAGGRPPGIRGAASASSSAPAKQRAGCLGA
jgi:hypothetical protein